MKDGNGRSEGYEGRARREAGEYCVCCILVALNNFEI